MGHRLIRPATEISVGITWVDGRVVFKSSSYWAKAFFGICHYSKSVWMITPVDYLQPTMMTTIMVSPEIQYCDHADTCLNFTCAFNKFEKAALINMFRDCGSFSLALPYELGKEPLWFNEHPYKDFWSKFILHVSGGTIRADESKV